MVLLSVCTERQNVRPYCTYNKQFDKLLHDVSCGRTHSTNTQPIGNRGAEEKRTEKGKRRLAKEWVRSWSSHVPGRRSDLRKCLQTDARRTPHDGIAHHVKEWAKKTTNIYTAHTHTHTTVLRLCGICPRQPGWAGTRRNIHPLTLIVVINHSNLLSLSTT